ncbi:sigma 54-interacting transcriptional regulator [Luteitalea pratensis]|uniref:sigma 54-interacting transcriptional regulator n=1 Tax=Luteitalea pratensis TaxID=1855912 RepID=UPI00138FA2C6|nr:sigma 54-interacting transcriptional regulator [Luteitalea pratensis]
MFTTAIATANSSDIPAHGTVTFARLIADLVARFVNIPPDTVDDTIVDTQRQIVQALGMDRSLFFQVGPGGDLVFTHQWTRPEFAHYDVPDHMSALSAQAQFPWLLNQLRVGTIVVVDDVDELPSDLDRENLRRVGTRSNVTVPIFVDGELIGALSVASLGMPRAATPILKDAMRLVGQVFGQALQHRSDQQQLQRAMREVTQLRDLLARDNELLHREVKQLRCNSGVTADSGAARETLQLVEQVAPTGATVLLLGETGAGKEVFAKEIHELSPRAKRPMVRVNCGAIPTALIESELFGREKGAYTGAVSRQVGRFEMAEGSTIFLDEIGELPLEAQVKLLRVLQDRVVERLGSTQPIKVDVRIIAATNRNLEDAVAARTFREDLFYRLNVFPITVPPLRERVEDIPALVWAFIEECSKHFGKSVTSVSRESMEALQRYTWPGNIRELRNTVEHAMILANSPKLVIPAPTARGNARQRSLKLTDVEAAHIKAVLDSTGWRVRGPGGAAELLGVKPTTLEGRMARLGVRRPSTAAGH